MINWLASTKNKNQRTIDREQQQQQTQKTATPKYKQEVEQIVQEEREAKSKMPSYKGLENYKLLEKMGEYVVSTA